MSTQLKTGEVVLEPAAQEFADATSTPPFIYELSPDDAREVLEGVQRSPTDKPDIEIQDITIAGGPHGDIAVRLLKPPGSTATLPVILYVHGAGWVLGSAETHDLLVRNLAVGAQAAVVFPEYRRAPEAQFTPPRSTRPTPRRPGSSSTDASTASTRITWRSPATPSAAT
jgi:acetyl esterase